MPTVILFEGILVSYIRFVRRTFTSANVCLWWQSDNMTDKWHVYMTKDGRISLAGLNLAKCAYLADAIIDSYYNIQ